MGRRGHEDVRSLESDGTLGIMEDTSRGEETRRTGRGRGFRQTGQKKERKK